MTRITKMFALAAAVVALAACAAAGTGKSPIPEVEGKTVYTQLNFWVLEGEHEATNYRLGSMIPVNSKVRIENTSGSTIQGTVVDSGERITIINVPKYTKKDIEAIYHRYFASSPKDLSGFRPAEQRAIQAGEIEQGMSKAAVLVARGYPPAHATPSTDEDEWRYWKGGHDTRLIRFQSGRVSSIKD